MYYLYKLSLSGTPKYYVGVTNNPVTRQAGHISAINESIRSLRSGKDLLGEAYHIVIAKHILSVEKKKYRQDPIFFVSFKVVLEVGETLEKAISAENRYLSRRGKHCLNKIGRSYYKGGRVDYSARYKWICDQMSKGVL